MKIILKQNAMLIHLYLISILQAAGQGDDGRVTTWLIPPFLQFSIK
jgi:hypothetical protein